MLFAQTVEARTLDLIQRLMNEERLENFRLVGGTALALCIGHRISIDIDLFSVDDFSSSELRVYLESKYSTDRFTAIRNGLFGFIEDIKIDLITHNYAWLMPATVYQGIRMASLQDICAMKVHAIVQNGSRLKDFVDLYHLLESFTFNEIVNYYVAKYPDTNATLASNALGYFSDIDFNVPLKLVNEEFKWSECEKRLRLAQIKRDCLF